MEEIELIFPTNEWKEKIMDYRQEFFTNNEMIINGDGGLDSCQSFEEWLEKITNDLNQTNDDRVSATLFIAIRKKDKKLIGTIQIRHYLNEFLLNCGGHIGYSIRPIERNKGYATNMLSLAIKECLKMGIEKVLITCDKSNIASAKTIIKNYGKLENEVVYDNEITQRYWIDVKQSIQLYNEKT